MMIKLFDEIPYLENDRIVLKRLEDGDAGSLESFVKSDEVYLYLPTYLIEQQHDAHTVIRMLYDDCIRAKDSLILGIFLKDRMQFCGLAEFYDFRDNIHQTCIGYRLAKEFWGRGIASEVVKLMVDHLYNETDIEIITASTMIENGASEHVLEKNGFLKSAGAVPEDWGYDDPTMANIWFV